MSQHENESPVEKLATLIKDLKYAMLTTVDDDGSLRSRPMATQNDTFDGNLWFFTRANSPKVHEIEHEQHVNVSYAHPDDQTYVSVSGKARLVRDDRKKEELWTPAMKAWFPKGPEDPEIALLNVTVEKAEYWETASSTVVHLIGFVKAVVTGKPYHPGENEKITL